MEELPLKNTSHGLSNTCAPGELEQPTWKQGGEAGMQSRHKPHPQGSDSKMGRNSEPGVSSWGAKGSNPTCTPIFKTCTWEINSPKPTFGNQQGLTLKNPQGHHNLRKQLLKVLHLGLTHPKAQHRSNWLRGAQNICEWRSLANLKVSAWGAGI